MSKKISVAMIFAALGSVGVNASAQVVGQFETASQTHFSGWACVGGTTQKVDVHFWSNLGEFVTGTATNKALGAPWSWFCGNNTAIGFEVPVPSAFSDGKSRLISAYAITPSNQVQMLPGSPKRVNFRSAGRQYVSVFDHRTAWVNYDDVNNATVSLGEVGKECIYRIAKICVTINYLGDAADDYPIGVDFSGITGFTPYVNNPNEKSYYQRGPANNSKTALQVQGATVGMSIDMDSIPLNSRLGNVDINSAAQAMFQPVSVFSPPPANSSQIISEELGFSFEANLQTLSEADLRVADGNSGAPKGVVQNYVAIQFQDKVDDSKWFYYLVQFGDRRGAEPEGVQPEDLYTCVPIVKTTFAPGMALGHQGTGSASFSSSPWGDVRHFEWRISRAEMTKILQTLNAKAPPKRKVNNNCIVNGQWSSALQDYNINAFFVSPEVHQAPDRDAKQQSVGLMVRNMQLWVEK